jgi:two-component system phosphate regulon sensor histidine kinase PhoR
VVPIIREFSQDLPVYLEVDIEQSPYSFHRWFWIQIVLAIMFSSGMIWAFWFVAKGLIQQKRISDMKTDFINNVSHELKTPLATISLAADALKKSEVQQQEAQVDVYANIVKEEGKKMNRQVEQILNAALLEKQDLSLNKTTLDLNQVLGEVVESFSLQLQEKNGTINLTKNVSTVSCVGDEFHLKHVFTNLIDNAIKYSKESPEITVDIKMEPKHVVVSVSDKGIGMTIEEQGHLFEKFYRVSEGNLHSVKGFGLGYIM